MGKINFGKVLIGGIAGGIVSFLLGGLIYSVIFKSAMDTGVAAGMMKAPDTSTLTMEFLNGTLFAILGTYVYALARPRLGASVASAVKVSLLMVLFYFLSGAAAMMIWSAKGCGDAGSMLPMLAGLGIPFAATFVGAWIYKD